jgi:anti-sigma factor RsiW
MDESIKSEKAVREYLLRRVSDEETLEAIEELMFTDDEFGNQVALAEDGLIDEYVRGQLNAADSESFEETLETDPDRLLKVQVTRGVREKALARDAARKHDRLSIFASISAFLRQPRYAAAFAAVLVAVF